MALRNIIYPEISWTKAICLLFGLLTLGRGTGSSKTRTLQLINTLIFLKHGIYRCPVERITQIIPLNQSDEEPVLANEYLTSQVMLNGFSGSITGILPLLNVQRLWQTIRPLSGLQPTTYQCGKCHTETPEMPIRIQCGHVYCYYCLALECYDHDQHVCLVCRNSIETD